MTVSITIEVAGLDRTIADLATASDRIDIELTKAMTESVFTVESAVKSLTPRVTGRLFSSIQGEVFSPILGRVGTSVHYAPFVEVGRGPIAAKHLTASGRPGFLKFKIGGRTIFRRSSGPAAGRRMFLGGLTASMPRVREIFRDAIRRALGR